MGKKIIIGIIIILSFLLCRCCRPIYNIPMGKGPIYPKDTTVVVQDSQTLLFATFSGGGTRAMALSYYVCSELNTIPYKKHYIKEEWVETSLMQEIDYVSGVSGGSFTASALPVYKTKWDTFETIGVKKNIQGSIIWRLFWPWNWPYLLSPYYDRTDLAAEFYKKHIFKNKVFGNIPKHPKIYINSTLLAEGNHFVFSKEYFKYIRSDFDNYPLGFACAASSAFPVGFTPITLKNYSDSLTEKELLKDPKYKRALRNSERDINQYNYLKLRKFLNNKYNKWLHLQDGGLAGNTGIKRVLDEWKTNGEINQAINNSKCPLKRLIVLVINAGTEKVDESCRKQNAPNSMEVVLYTTTTAMDILSSERLEKLKDKMDELWQTALISRKPGSFPDKALSKLEKPYLIEINARNIKDENLKNEFNDIPTSFNLSEKHLEVIKRTSVHLLENNKDYVRLLKSINSVVTY